MTEEKYIEARRMLLRFIADEARSKGITQKQLAEITGFKQQSVSRMLAGKFSPTLDNFIKIAEAVNVYFFLESKDAKTENSKQMRTRHDRPGDKN